MTPAPARQPLDEIDEKIQRFVAVYAPGLSMHDHAVLCEGIMDIIIDATHTSPPAPRPPCEECMYQERIDKAAKAEREKMLKLIETSRDALQEKHVDGNYDIRTHAKIEILSWLYHQVESLRAQQERPKERQIFEAYPK